MQERRMAHAIGFRRFLLAGVSFLTAGIPALAQPPTRKAAPKTVPNSVPHTIEQALATVYMNQPVLQAARAQLRSIDENVPQALAGWKPTIVVAGSTGYGNGILRQYIAPAWQKAQTDRDIATGQTTITQPLYTGGVRPNVNRATDQVMAQRANLLAQEETSFANAVNAYVGVIENGQLLQLQINNERVLREQLRSTNDQYRVGEVTRTDVAQAEASLALAIAQRQTAEGNLQTANATYVQIIGYQPPADLVPPQPLAVPVMSDRQAAILAASNNPAVVAARFNDAAAKNAVEAAFGALLPTLNIQGQIFQSTNSAARSTYSNGYQGLLNLSAPLYQGGSEYSAVRQARETEQQQQQLILDAQRTAVQEAVNAWETLIAARAAAASTRTAITANQIALVGVEREHLVGTRTTLDVLNAQQTLLNSQVTLVQNLANLVTASYGVASAIGRLNARDLKLRVPLYDDTGYYNRVKNKWVGIGVPPPDAYFGHPPPEH
jgi:outer membrane protein